MKIKEFKSFIREEIIGVLSEDTIDVPNPNTLTPDQKRTLINTAKTKTKNPSLGTPANPVDFVEEELGNNLTPLQQTVYEFESEVSPNPDEFIEDIKKLNSVKDVYDYYATKRGWLQDKDLKYSLKELLKYLVKKKLTTTAELKQLFINEENDLNEMARAKVSYILNQEMKDELASLIEKAKGNVKKALEYLLEKGEMSVADVAKEFGLADTASINNPKFRELMGMLKDKGVVSMGGAPATPKATTAKPSKEKIEKTVKAVEKDINTGEEEADDYYKAGDEDSAPDETDIDKQAAKAANKLTKRTSKLDKVLKGLIQVEKEMKELAGEYKNAEGEEKANIVAKLKEKTAQKKELEALKDKFEFDVV
jgi:hypothetical protein